MTGLGYAPANNSPWDIRVAIQRVYDERYNAGYNAGQSASSAQGSYRIRFSGNYRDIEQNAWIKVDDKVCIDIGADGSVQLSTRENSFLNGQVDVTIEKF